MGWESFHYQRYILTMMGFTATFTAYALRMCLSITITVMAVAPNHTAKIDLNACPGVLNESTTSNTTAVKADFNWDEATQGLILSSFYWGYIITHIPGGLLAQRFGGKHTLGFGMLSTAIFTLLSPFAAYQGSTWFIILRFLEGLGEGTTFPALNQLLAVWIPLSERGRVGAFVFAGVQFGLMASSMVSASLLQLTKNYWPCVFYMWGTLGLVWFVAWTLLCFNDPASHPFISQKEKDYLETEMGGLSRPKDLPSTPWLKIAVNPPLIALVIAELGHDWGLYTISSDLPKYMHSVLKLNVLSNGFLSGLPFLFMWLFAQVAGWISDSMVKKKMFSVTTVRKIFTSVGAMGPAIGLIMASYAGCNRVLTVVMFTIGMGFMGFYYPSVRVNALDLSPNYAGTLMAIVNGVGAISGILSPYVVGLLVPNSTLMEWRIVFWVTFCILVLSNVCYLFFGSAEVQPWNGPEVITEPPPVLEPE